MSIDRTLKIKNALSRHRNVLSRDERVARLKDEERWTEEDPVTSLPKVAHRKGHSGKKAATAEKTAEGQVAADAPAAEKKE